MPHRNFKLGSLTVWLIGGVGLLFLTLPILALILRAIENRAWQSVEAAVIPEAVYLSFITTLLTVILTALFGTPLAYLFARFRFPFKRLLNVLIELPIVMPPAVAGLALLVTFGRRGLLGPVLDDLGIRLSFSGIAVVMAQTFVAAPFFIRAAQIGFQAVSREIEDAARVDGADGLALFFRITLPLSSRALSAGLILCWARALGEFGATILFAGNSEGRTRTMTLLVYTLFEGNLDAAVWTGLLLIGLALMALMASQWLAHKTSTDESES